MTSTAPQFLAIYIQEVRKNNNDLTSSEAYALKTIHGRLVSGNTPCPPSALGEMEAIKSKIDRAVPYDGQWFIDLLEIWDTDNLLDPDGLDLHKVFKTPNKPNEV